MWLVSKIRTYRFLQMPESLVWDQGDDHSTAWSFAFERFKADIRQGGFSILQAQSRKRQATWKNLEKAQETKGKAEEGLATEDSEP